MNIQYPNHINVAQLDSSRAFDCDVVICGTGAGGGVAAEILTQAGYKVIMLEEGPLKRSSDFDMQEKTAYATLYQEAAGRKTKDKAINILQGRAVGGSTTVNWTSSFRTPQKTLEYWSDNFHIKDILYENMEPWFIRMEQRLNISPWVSPANENNAILARGAKALSLTPKVIPRNVNGCINLGYCGTDCPINAKQSMLVSTIPTALESGATLLSCCRAQKILTEKDKAIGVKAFAINKYGKLKKDIVITVHTAKVIVAGGAINSPALLLRSKLPDPYRTLGKRTFLHPVSLVTGIMSKPVNAFSGAPQSVYVDDLLWCDGVTGKVGYKLETAPMHPLLASTVFLHHGSHHYDIMQKFPYMQASLALLRDGFNDDSVGGEVTLDKYDYPVLDYPITDYIWEGIQHSWLTMTELLFAAGAKHVIPLHLDSSIYSSWNKARQAIKKLPLKKLRAQVASAHVMGGCTMGGDINNSVVDSHGRYHHVKNLFVFDGSLFPTSIGANPQLSIYALIAKLTNNLIQSDSLK